MLSHNIFLHFDRLRTLYEKSLNIPLLYIIFKLQNSLQKAFDFSQSNYFKILIA